MRKFNTVYLLHGKGGSPNGTVALLEAAFADVLVGCRFIRPEMPHHDPEVRAEESVRFLEALTPAENALIIGVSLGGIVAAKVQEQSRGDLHVIAISSPTEADGVRLEHRAANRVALYSSKDEVIADRVADWPKLAEAYDLGWLTHQTDAHIPQLHGFVAAYVEGTSLADVARSFAAR